jgi:hypothetical protein
MTNWICRSLWVTPTLPRDARPISLRGEDFEGIQIAWNDQYKSLKEYYESQKGSKEEIIKSHQRIINAILDLAKQAIEDFEKFTKNSISEGEFISKMQQMQPRVRELYSEGQQVPIPPVECQDYHQSCHNIYATVDNIFLWYSKTEIDKRPSKTRNWLLQKDIERLYKYVEKLKFEEEKLH